MLSNAATSQRSEKVPDCSTNTHTHHNNNNNNKPLVSLPEGQEVVKRFLAVSDWPGSKVNRLVADSARSRTGGERERGP